MKLVVLFPSCYIFIIFLFFLLIGSIFLECRNENVFFEIKTLMLQEFLMFFYKKNCSNMGVGVCRSEPGRDCNF